MYIYIYVYIYIYICIHYLKLPGHHFPSYTYMDFDVYIHRHIYLMISIYIYKYILTSIKSIYTPSLTGLSHDFPRLPRPGDPWPFEARRVAPGHRRRGRHGLDGGGDWESRGRQSDPPRKPVEPGGTRWNPVEPGGTRWNPVEPGGTRWNPVELVFLIAIPKLTSIIY